MPPQIDGNPPQIGGVILAAGAARRFGAQKLLAQLDGRPLVQHVIDAANASSLEEIVLVVGTDVDDLVGHVELGRTRVVRNPDPSRGLASSLQAGLRTLDQRLHGALVLLGDIPGVTSALIDELVARGRETRASAVISVWRGRRSPPVVLHKSMWADAFTLHGDIGMRDVLNDKDVVEFTVTDALGSLDDIDTPEDHARVSRRASS
ncbi:MAG: nucleotidyltransferase family protein [Chloroflexota bacterium]|nr:nucleotidyltransferase family protein [Chloroflexota bacterium]